MKYASRLAALALLLTIPAPASGQRAAPAAALPPAAEVVARFIREIGGREAVGKYSTRRATGTFEMPAQGLRGPLEVLAGKPNKTMVRLTVPGVGEISSGFDGEVGWIVNPMTGPMLLEGKALEQTREDSSFLSALHDDVKSMETLERTEFEGIACYKLRVVRASGSEDLEFFDVAAGLLVGSITARESPMGTMTVTSVYRDYKDFDGVRLPATSIQRVAGVEQILRIERVEHNALSEAAFQPPEVVRTLAGRKR
jgi:hypothetical protein